MVSKPGNEPSYLRVCGGRGGAECTITTTATDPTLLGKTLILLLLTLGREAPSPHFQLTSPHLLQTFFPTTSQLSLIFSQKLSCFIVDFAVSTTDRNDSYNDFIVINLVDKSVANGA